MTAIQEALLRVMNHENTGYVMACGELKYCHCGESEVCVDCDLSKKYMIITGEDESEEKFETIIDDGGAVRISDDIKVFDNVILNIKDNYSAIWEVM